MRVTGERGSVAVEILGVAALVAAVMAVVAAAAPGVADLVTAGIQRALCVTSDEDCGAPAASGGAGAGGGTVASDTGGEEAAAGDAESGQHSWPPGTGAATSTGDLSGAATLALGASGGFPGGGWPYDVTSTSPYEITSLGPSSSFVLASMTPGEPGAPDDTPLDFGQLDTALDGRIIGDPDALEAAREREAETHRRYFRELMPEEDRIFDEWLAAEESRLEAESAGEADPALVAAAEDASRRLEEASARALAGYHEWMDARWARTQHEARVEGTRSVRDRADRLEALTRDPGGQVYGIQRITGSQDTGLRLEPAPEAAPDLFEGIAEAADVGSNLNPTGAAGTCGNTALACDAWLQGRPASGAQWSFPPDHISSRELEERTTAPVPMEGVFDLVDLLPNPGDRGIVRVRIAREGEEPVGHVFNAVNRDGTVYTVNFGGTGTLDELSEWTLYRTDAPAPVPSPVEGLDFDLLDPDQDYWILSDPLPVVAAANREAVAEQRYFEGLLPEVERATDDWFAAEEARVEAGDAALADPRYDAAVEEAAQRMLEAETRAADGYEEWDNARRALELAEERYRRARQRPDRNEQAQERLRDPQGHLYGIQRVVGDGQLETAGEAAGRLFVGLDDPLDVLLNLNPASAAAACGNLALACDAWLAGRPASGTQVMDPPGPITYEELVDRFGEPESMEGVADLSDLLPNPGDRGIVGVTIDQWEGQESIGHVFNVVNHDGTVYTINFGGSGTLEQLSDWTLFRTTPPPGEPEERAETPTASGDEDATPEAEADQGVERAGGGGGIVVRPELPGYDPELDGSRPNPFPAPEPGTVDVETFPGALPDLEYPHTGTPDGTAPDELWNEPETFPAGEEAPPQIYTFPLPPEDEAETADVDAAALRSQMETWQDELRTRDGIVTDQAAGVFNNRSDELERTFGLTPREATELLGGTYSNTVGQRLVGPAIVGPAIVGPAIVGPAIVGPCLEGMPCWGNGPAGLGHTPATGRGTSPAITTSPAVDSPTTTPAATSGGRRPEHDDVGSWTPQPAPVTTPTGGGVDWGAVGRTALDVITTPHPLDPFRGPLRGVLPIFGPASGRQLAY